MLLSEDMTKTTAGNDFQLSATLPTDGQAYNFIGAGAGAF
jgi:hypothetical protein